MRKNLLKEQGRHNAPIYGSIYDYFPTNLRNKFDSMYPGPPDEQQPHVDGSYDHKPTWLTHAKIYIFADYNGIEVLRFLSLRRLRESVSTLGRKNLGQKGCAEGFIKLAKYCFENTSGCTKGSVDKLQNLLLCYASANIDILGNIDEFRELTESRRSLALLDCIRQDLTR